MVAPEGQTYAAVWRIWHSRVMALGCPVRAWTTVVGVLAALLVVAPGADARTVARNAPLTEPQEALERALECGRGVRSAARSPVILVHGTGSTPEESFSFGYADVLPELGFPVCTVRLPERALIDQQRSAQYVVHAIREVFTRSGRKVSLIGHSQGGALAAYAPYFWLDVPGKVDDVIGLAGTYRGTSQANRSCDDGRCSVTSWHFRLGSALNRAFLGQPQPGGPSFTSIASAQDELVTPSPEASRLEGASNVVIQDLCPARPVDHFSIVGDAVAFSVALDALTNDGPARTERFDPATCAQGPIPGSDLPRTATTGPLAITNAVVALLTAPEVDREPPLICPFEPARCPAPELRLIRACTAEGRLRTRLTGDIEAVRDVNFKLDKRLARRDVRAPFAATIAARTLRRTDAEHVRAVAYLRGPGSARVILARSLPRCGR